jgi:hypothetical protein
VDVPTSAQGHTEVHITVAELDQSVIGHNTTAELAAQATSVAKYYDVESRVREYFSDIPMMAEVARCESTFRHTHADGRVLRGYVDNRDTGVMQINTFYHLATAEAMGLDVENFYDNLAYARHLYERQGLQPWNASRPCWGNQLAYNY